jgi:hypothetical protein
MAFVIQYQKRKELQTDSPRHECPLNVEGELNEIQFWPDTKI